MKNKEKLKWKLTLTYTAMVFSIVALFVISFSVGIRSYYMGNIEELLRHGIAATVELYDTRLGEKPLEQKAKFLLESGIIPEYVEAQVIDVDGDILDTTARFTPEKTVETPDFNGAIGGEVSIWRGRLTSTGERIMAISAPILSNTAIIGAIRYITSIEDLERAILSYSFWAIAIGFGVVFIAFVISYMLAARIVKPVIELKNAADAYAYGDFEIKATRYSDDELGELADAFNYMAAELERAGREKNEFISSISHEIRTPLTSIMGWSETLLDGGDEEERRMGLEIISRESERLTGLVENLLDFSKMENARLELKIADFDLKALLERTARQFSKVAEKKKIKLKLELAAGKLSCRGDMHRIKQVLVNIMDNSIKYCYYGGNVTLRCTETVSREDKNYHIIELEDDGAGIPMEHLSRIGEMFYKADRSKRGSGIGLAISNKIIELHGGSLVLSNIEPHGTKVSIELPGGAR